MNCTEAASRPAAFADFFTPATVVAAGLVVSCFSGNWHYMSVPIPLDRVIIFFGLVWAAMRARREGEIHLRWRVEHTLVLILCSWALVSSALAGTLLSTDGAFAILDRLGIIPFLILFLSPIVFRNPRERSHMLRALVLLGLYLSFASITDSFRLPGLWPGYIGNDAIGYHAERARGPYLEAVANGLMLVSTGIASYFVAQSQAPQRWRFLGCAVVVLSAFSLLLTLTRAAWLAGIVAIAILLVVDPRSRRLALPAAVVVAAAGALAFVLLPSLFANIGDRAGEERPVWDRLNTNRAAFRMIEDHPMGGVGWQNAAIVMEDYVRQADTYPTTGAGTPIHNVPLARAAELGLPGLLAWTAAIGALIWRVFASTPASSRDQALRATTLCFVGAFLTVAMFGPLPYPQPNYLFGALVGMSVSSYLRPGHGASSDVPPTRQVL